MGFTKKSFIVFTAFIVENAINSQFLNSSMRLILSSSNNEELYKK
jgi:hypothetical protein